MSVTKITVEDIAGFKGKAGSLAALTAYDFPTARILDDAGIPLILVGDSLGMVVLGYEDTTHVTMDDMIHHLKAVQRADPHALLAVDLPYGTFSDPASAVENAKRLVDAGAEAVKAEGGVVIADTVHAIVSEGIAFLGHLGMLPQSVKEIGGYRIYGKTDEEHLRLLDDGTALVDAGAFAVVLELIQPEVARDITQKIPIPTIGIGAGPWCDGQILVTPDLVKYAVGPVPRHVSPKADFAGDLARAIGQWMAEIREDGRNK
ncbi:3-methyl-2-oxobutanoate hydroxymethyltransferase [Verrucomicrobia bacterium]|nr:3-methyl-2-oxobutanoate hydroxymethyltransferase [Verrucomicrobiota bacterium]